MIRNIIDLSVKFPPRFKGQRAYCEEIRSWLVAVPSASGVGYRWLLPPAAIAAIEDNA